MVATMVHASMRTGGYAKVNTGSSNVSDRTRSGNRRA